MAGNTKRAYKLQEFVAHSSNVNCLKIGKKTSRVLLTGGEDHKVNLWAIGKPNSILSLSGHTSAVESVSFDQSEVFVAAGAASGTIKLWDLEEAKIVRTLTGHRSNATSVDFHPFGEFFASGSLDTNLKIWDIRRKGCIHTYKGHTRGVNAIRFTPDGRWVVSGGEDNAVKLWDLTAGKLLHEFKAHEGQIQCIDFHPHEFLLATGSADKTVKFWDLETFELIGSSVPETTGVRAMTFNPDGRTLLCGLHESLKVCSWEPMRSFDSVDVGWSRLSDLNIHEGKLLGCSFNQSCVGVWVVDLSRVEPYASGGISKLNALEETRSNNNTSIVTVQNESSSVKSGMARLPVTQASEINSKPRVSVSQNTELLTQKEPKLTPSVPPSPQRMGLPTTKIMAPSLRRRNYNTNPITVPRAVSRPEMGRTDSADLSSPSVISRLNSRPGPTADLASPAVVPRSNSRPGPTVDVAPPAVASRSNSRPGPTPEPKKESTFDVPVQIFVPKNNTGSSRSNNEGGRTSHSNKGFSEQSEVGSGGRTSPFLRNNNNEVGIGGRTSPFLRNINNSNNNNNEVGNGGRTSQFVRNNNNDNNEVVNGEDYRGFGLGKMGSGGGAEGNHPSQHMESFNMRAPKPYVEVSRGGRTRTLVSSWETREQTPPSECPSPSMQYSSNREPEKSTSSEDEDGVSDLMDQHDIFLSSARSRLTKLNVVRQNWERNDVRGVISALERISDHAVSADVVSILTEKSDIITLDLCTCLLPLITALLESKTERHLSISLELLIKLVRTFGSMIHSTMTAGMSSVGIDLQMEQRLERCNLCFIELEKVKNKLLPTLTRRKGTVGKTAQELNLALQEVV